MGFVHDYAYQDCDYRIRTMLYIWEVSSLAPSCTQHCISSPKYTCDQVGQAMQTSF